jgi:hypothetical protein
MVCGAVSCGLVACSNEPQLAWTDSEVTVVSPSSHDFGSFTVGQASAPFTHNVNPGAGANYDVVTAVQASCPDFVIDAPGLPAEVFRTCDTTTCASAICPAQLICTTLDFQSYPFTTQFTPTVAGPLSCPVTIVFQDGTTRSVTLTGTGVAPPIDIDVTPGGVAFGDVRRNTASSPATVTVRNLGSSTLSVSSVAVSGPFVVTGPVGPYDVGAGASQPYTLTCNPIDLGGTAGELTIISNDPSTPSVGIPLSCNGIDSNLDIAPSPAVVATTRVGEPVQQAISVGNTGTLPTTIEGISVAGAGITLSGLPAFPLVLNPTEVTSITATFDAAAHGDASATLTVTFDGGQVRTSQITARALTATMSLDPDGEVDFGPVCAGQTTTKAFTVLGNGDGGFTIQSFGDLTAPFTGTFPAVPAAVSALGANQITFDVVAAPVDVGLGSSTLAIATDIPGAAPRLLQLLVHSLATGVGATPEAADLGSLPVDTTTLGQPIDITNCTANPLTLLAAHIDGVDAPEFAIVMTPQSSTVAPTSSARYLVVLQPRSIGQKHAELVIEHDQGTTIIPLDGDGLGSGVHPGDTSYYACSTGGSGGALAAWPVLLVIVLRLRRRR